MKKLVLLFLIFTSLHTYAQEYKDTTFTVRRSTCTCRYILNSEDDNRIFTVSEKPAQYPGGEEEWKIFLKKNLDKSLKGKDKVEVRFQVDKNGDLSSFEIMNRSPVQKFEEIVRVLKLSGKWLPAIQNLYCVKAWITLTFEL